MYLPVCLMDEMNFANESMAHGYGDLGFWDFDTACTREGLK